jgi:hypothetical protein
MFPAVLLLNVGFIAAELVIQAQAMNGVTAALSIPPGSWSWPSRRR